ncbi:hypothetical protein [Psychrobacter pygoscelis]|uniref:hypothetical protein n=1 Tax=Psychrobacter pygoscelis TaxID=2488563 RepID=UPI00103F7BD8|nr:hypothetical protein [Psychrobacter pygoscelis]
MNKSIKGTLPKAILMATVSFGAVLLSACGGEGHEEVKAPDRVEEAAELARANAPEAEVIEFETTPAPQVDTADGEGDAADTAAPATDAEANPEAEADAAAAVSPTDATTDTAEAATADTANAADASTTN